MSGLPPNGNSVSKYDVIAERLAQSPGEWQEVKRCLNSNTTTLRQRYGKDFEFVSRTGKEEIVVWGRYIGKPGAFSLAKFYGGRHIYDTSGRRTLVSA